MSTGEAIAGIAFAAAWAVGVVLVKGFWSTLAAVLLPPYGWVLLAQQLMGASA